MEKKSRKPKQKFKLKVKESVCYTKTNLLREEEGYFIHFIPSGFSGIWIKVWEYYDYTVGIDYASPEENEVLNKVK